MDKQIRKANQNKMLAIFGTILILLILLSGIKDSIRYEDTVGQARTFTTLSYCSNENDKQCAPNTAWLTIRPFARRKDVSERHNREPVTYLSLILDQVEVKLEEKAQDRLPEEVWLVEDTNKSGGIDSSDKKLARGVVKKKTLLFEDIQQSLLNSPIPDEGYEQAKLFFISSYDQKWDLTDYFYEDDSGAIVSRRIIKSVSSTVFDVQDENRILLDKGVFADLSLFEYRDKQQQSKAEFLKDNPFFKDVTDYILWPSGDYEITEDLIIPVGLRIRVGSDVHIKIAENITVLSYSPIDFYGTSEKPITISNLADKPYGTFAIIGRVDSPDNILIDYLRVSGGNEDRINGIIATGMFSIYRFNNVKVINSNFTGSASDDGLNIKNSNVYLANNVFKNNFADGWDADFVTGLAENNLFIDNGNDSMDFSGSKITVKNNRIINSGDKCISVGEGTKIKISSNILNGCSIGVEVKDKSDAVITNNAIINNGMYGINAYIKKSFWGAPTLSAINNVILNNDEQLGGLAVGQVDLNQNTTSGIYNNLIQVVPWLNLAENNSPKK